MKSRILSLALPSIVSNITVPLLGLVDVAITGHLGSSRYMASIAVGSMLMNIIYWLFAFLRFGTGGLTAQAYGSCTAAQQQNGRKDMAECAYVAIRSLIVCLAIALAIVCLQTPLFHVAMVFISPQPYLMETIHTYFAICIWGAFPSLMLFAFTGWFVGMQNTKVPMVVSITQNVVNIVLSYYFVYFVGMKIEGVAYGTLVAQCVGTFIAFAMLVAKYGDVFKGVNWKNAFHFEDLKRFFSVNRLIFLRTLFLVAVNLFVIKAGATGGAEILAVNSVIMQMFTLYSYVMDGFAFAAEALCGKYYGAGNSFEFYGTVRGVWKWGVALTVLYTIFYYLEGRDIVAILTDNPAVRLLSIEYLPWAALIPFCGLGAFVWDGVFVGITNVRGMMLGTLAGAAVFFAIYYSINGILANHALWIAFNAYLFGRGLMQQVVYARWKKTAFA